MSRRRARAWLFAALTTFSLLALPALAQDEPPPESEENAEAVEGEESFEELEALSSPEEIESILEQGEVVLSGGGSNYDAGGRRDPFRSLLVTVEDKKRTGPRPEGVPGLMIDELILSGIFRTKNGFMAQVQSAERGKSFLIRSGDQLFDGIVVEIRPNELELKQDVKDPTALKPFRMVVKALNPQKKN